MAVGRGRLGVVGARAAVAVVAAAVVTPAVMTPAVVAAAAAAAIETCVAETAGVRDGVVPARAVMAAGADGGRATRAGVHDRRLLVTGSRPGAAMFAVRDRLAGAAAAMGGGDMGRRVVGHDRRRVAVGVRRSDNEGVKAL